MGVTRLILSQLRLPIPPQPQADNVKYIGEGKSGQLGTSNPFSDFWTLYFEDFAAACIASTAQPRDKFHFGCIDQTTGQ